MKQPLSPFTRFEPGVRIVGVYLSFPLAHLALTVIGQKAVDTAIGDNYDRVLTDLAELLYVAFLHPEV